METNRKTCWILSRFNLIFTIPKHTSLNCYCFFSYFDIYWLHNWCKSDSQNGKIHTITLVGWERIFKEIKKKNRSRFFTDPEQQEFREYTSGRSFETEWKQQIHRHDTLNRHNLRLQALQVDWRSALWGWPFSLSHDSVESARNLVKRRVLVFLFICTYLVSNVLIPFITHFFFCFVFVSFFLLHN